jgi:hypothetical protein
MTWLAVCRVGGVAWLILLVSDIHRRVADIQSKLNAMRAEKPPTQ